MACADRGAVCRQLLYKRIKCRFYVGLLWDDLRDGGGRSDGCAEGCSIPRGYEEIGTRMMPPLEVIDDWHSAEASV